MRADYDSQGDTLAIELEAVGQLDSGDDTVHPRAVVGLVDGRPVKIDVLGAGANVDAALAAVAEHYELDIEALKAAARSALEAPDRQVVLEVLERA